MSSENLPLQSRQCSPNLAGLRLLVVEADADTRLMYRCVFEDYGAQVLTATSVSEAIKILVEDQLSHLLITEISLPEEDGYSLLHRVRSLSSSHKHIPVIAITALSCEHPGQQTASTQFQRYLIKPIDLDELLAIVADLARYRQFELLLEQGIIHL